MPPIRAFSRFRISFPSFGRGFDSHRPLHKPRDSVALPLLRLENGASWPEFWTQVGPNLLSRYPGRHKLSSDSGHWTPRSLRAYLIGSTVGWREATEGGAVLSLGAGESGRGRVLGATFPITLH